MTDAPRVLCVDDDRDLSEILQAVLSDEGYQVSFLYETSHDAVQRAIGRLEPDVVLLDSAGNLGYGEGWEVAAGIGTRHRPIPVVMFTAHHRDLDEARLGTSERSRDAAFAAIVPKPFEMDELLTAVAVAAKHSNPFDRSEKADEARTRALVRALRARGATNIKPSAFREWALFQDPQGSIGQVYWWQLRGVYQVGRYNEDGELSMIGQFYDRDLAIELAVPEAS